ncbi:MAG: 5-bromo-4-chloroindolyl phosphate hydrolysis family protein [Gemmiger sp.]|nr:5-bromo-4-chloroindolyl phosphate hydrolysis family protein [Gemmiger sp.]
MSKWVEIKKKPVLPFYLAGLVWLVGAILLPIYSLWAVVATAAASAAVFVVASRLCPLRVVRKELPYATGSEDVDAMLEGITTKLDALHQLNEGIPDATLSDALARMEKAGRGIVAAVDKMPEKANQVDRFARYYLPEVVKIMTSYANMEAGGIKGENAAQILGDVQKNAGTMATAFENQLDALYSAEAMDISTDIEVLDGILKGQNLAK